jgi:hypothetical protein
MKLELLVSKKWVKKASGEVEEPIFAVLDLDKAKTYPRNYVCLLPKIIDNTHKSTNKFLEIYGKESCQIAVELLTRALRSEADVIVRNEIEKRLKALQSKPNASATCVVCGCVFEPRKFGRFLQTTCQTCRNK